MGFLDKASRTLTKAVGQYGDTIEWSVDGPRRIPGQRTGARRGGPLDSVRQVGRSPELRDSRDDAPRR